MSNLVLIRMVRGPGREVEGKPIHVSQRMAVQMVGAGIAEYVTEPETAMAAPPENAMLPKARARKVVGR